METYTHLRAILPVDPTPPETTPYGLSALHTVPVFDGKEGRSLYRQYNNGQQAPAFRVRDTDGTPLPIKRWYITSSKSMVLGWYNATGSYTFREMSPAELAFINLPGDYNYPMPPPVSPSGAYWLASGESTNGRASGKQYLPDTMLSLYENALALGKELVSAGYKIGDVTETVLTGPFGVHYEIAEPRRIWNIMVNDMPINAASLLTLKNKNGIGGPGKWSTSTEAVTPVWNSFVGQQTEYSVIPESPVPMRKLLLTETLQVTPFGIKISQAGDTYQVAQTSLADVMALLQKIAAQPSGGGSSTLPPAVLSSLMSTNAVVKAIASQWGVNLPPGV
jgi:hypothetical protein